MSKHTPGPWVAHLGKSGDLDRIWSDEGFIADVWGAGATNASANGRLIAAAPTLVAALVGLMDAVPTQTNDRDWWPDELTRAMAAARKALDEAGIEP